MATSILDSIPDSRRVRPSAEGDAHVASPASELPTPTYYLELRLPSVPRLSEAISEQAGLTDPQRYRMTQLLTNLAEKYPEGSLSPQACRTFIRLFKDFSAPDVSLSIAEATLSRLSPDLDSPLGPTRVLRSLTLFCAWAGDAKDTLLRGVSAIKDQFTVPQLEAMAGVMYAGASRGPQAASLLEYAIVWSKGVCPPVEDLRDLAKVLAILSEPSKAVFMENFAPTLQSLAAEWNHRATRSAIANLGAAVASVGALGGILFANAPLVAVAGSTASVLRLYAHNQTKAIEQFFILEGPKLGALSRSLAACIVAQPTRSPTLEDILKRNPVHDTID